MQIQDLHCLPFCYWILTEPLFATMNMSKFRDGRIHVRNPAVKGLMIFRWHIRTQQSLYNLCVFCANVQTCGHSLPSLTFCRSVVCTLVIFLNYFIPYLSVAIKISMHAGPQFLVYLILRNKQFIYTIDCWFTCKFYTLDQFYSNKVWFFVWFAIYCRWPFFGSVYKVHRQSWPFVSLHFSVNIWR